MHSVTCFTVQTAFRSISHKSQKTTFITFAHPRNHIDMFVLLVIAYSKCKMQCNFSFICCICICIYSYIRRWQNATKHSTKVRQRKIKNANHKSSICVFVQHSDKHSAVVLRQFSKLVGSSSKAVLELASAVAYNGALAQPPLRGPLYRDRSTSWNGKRIGYVDVVAFGRPSRTVLY